LRPTLPRGSFTVARENLGNFPGLLAGAALMIDYILNVAVGISAAWVRWSRAASLQPHTLALCLGILAVITLIIFATARSRPHLLAPRISSWARSP